jgi:hypothetical protein
VIEKEEVDSCCDGCCGCCECDSREQLTVFRCRICHNKFQYCTTCLSVAVKSGMCLGCFEEGA